MKRSMSTYCDFVRLCAALVVYLEHLGQENRGSIALHFNPFGHAAVIVFFVLSGFIIAYVADERERLPREFVAARFGRLYSVVVPAVLLTIVLQAVGSWLDSSAYARIPAGTQAFQSLISLLFLNKLWLLDIPLLSNSPFWSLPYEFWYYVIFGAFWFLTGRARVMVLCGLALLVGPKILLYFPLWLAGAGVYFFGKRRRLRNALFWFLITPPVAMIFALLRYYGAIPIWTSDILPHGFSLADFVIGAAVALNLYAAQALDFRFGPIERVIRWGAGLSFSLYLLHVPLLRFIKIFVPHDWPAELVSVVLSICVLSLVAILGGFWEPQKGAWRNAALRVLRLWPQSIGTGGRG